MNVKIKFTEQSQSVAELRQEISRLETKVREGREEEIGELGYLMNPLTYRIQSYWPRESCDRIWTSQIE